MHSLAIQTSHSVLILNTFIKASCRTVAQKTNAIHLLQHRMQTLSWFIMEQNNFHQHIFHNSNRGAWEERYISKAFKCKTDALFGLQYAVIINVYCIRLKRKAFEIFFSSRMHLSYFHNINAVSSKYPKQALFKKINALFTIQYVGNWHDLCIRSKKATCKKKTVRDMHLGNNSTIGPLNDKYPKQAFTRETNALFVIEYVGNRYDLCVISMKWGF